MACTGSCCCKRESRCSVADSVRFMVPSCAAFVGELVKWALAASTSQLQEPETDVPLPSEEDQASFRTALEAQGTEAAAQAAAGLPSAQTIFAVVNADGTLARGFGAFSSQKIGTGTYQVVFSWITFFGAFTATLGRNDGTGLSEPGFVIANRFGPNAQNVVVVVTRDLTGTLSDRPFHLAVHNP